MTQYKMDTNKIAKYYDYREVKLSLGDAIPSYDSYNKYDKLESGIIKNIDKANELVSKTQKVVINLKKENNHNRLEKLSTNFIKKIKRITELCKTSLNKINEINEINKINKIKNSGFEKIVVNARIDTKLSDLITNMYSSNIMEIKFNGPNQQGVTQWVNYYDSLLNHMSVIHGQNKAVSDTGPVRRYEGLATPQLASPVYSYPFKY